MGKLYHRHRQGCSGHAGKDGMIGRMGAQQMGGRIGALNGSGTSMAPLARRRITTGISSDDVNTSRMSCVTSCPQATVVDN